MHIVMPTITTMAILVEFALTDREKRILTKLMTTEVPDQIHDVNVRHKPICQDAY